MSAALAIGSEEHKRLFCRTLIETHDPFDPDAIQWPRIDDAGRRRIASLPFWNDAMFDERNACRKLDRLAAAQSDPLLAEALALQGREEGRHARIIECMLRAYDIPIEEVRERPLPKNPEWSFIKLGYAECFDSFFAFGMFRMAQRSGFLPDELSKLFEPVVQEEARHILFFQNWIAYVRANRPVLHRPIHRLNCALGLGLSVWSRVKVAFQLKGGGNAKPDPEIPALAADFALRPYLELCLSENQRYLAPYDPRLLRPRIVPTLVAHLVRLLPRGRDSAAQADAKAA